MKAQKIGVFLVGINGSIGTTVTSGVYAAARGLVTPHGLVTELPGVNSLSLPPLADLRFYGWDLRSEPHLNRVREQPHIPLSLTEQIAPELSRVRVLPAPRVGVSTRVLGLSRVPDATAKGSRSDAVYSIRAAIRDTIAEEQLSGAVLVNIASTEPFAGLMPTHQSIGQFEEGLAKDDPAISAGMLYAYAALAAKVPYVNFTPSTTVDIPALMEFADVQGVVIAGKDGKTGQTLYKTVLAPMFQLRNLRVSGWYSTNLLGNDDGYVLSDPAHLQQKVASKLEALAPILGYDDVDHQVDIHYYAPRGDAKEAWDVIDFVGWLGAKMSMRVNWLGQDSILAAPLVVDLARLVWFAQQRGERGPATQLSAFFKTPLNTREHNFFEQTRNLMMYCDSASRRNGGD